ncbi:MAG: glycosyltransferase family 4 protein [Melioribacteraceae bacterium]|nr:glycosyltransferase family 4 protein [Melioribacteraceae bacterium]
MDKIYLVKNLTPWMVDEILAFSLITEFRLVLLRKPNDFYITRLKDIEANGIEIIYNPYEYNNLLRKVLFLIKFVFVNFPKFLKGYNSVIGGKSIFWFLKLDLKLFHESSTIHAQFATQPSIIALMLKKYYKNKLNYSFTFHAHDIYFKNKWFCKLVNESFISFSISVYNINYIDKHYKEINKGKIALSRLGVFPPRNSKKNKYNKNDQLVLGFLSWFVEKKGIKYLLEAVKVLSTKRKIKLKIAGDGPLLNYIKEFIKTNTLESYIEYLGKLDTKGKEDFYRSIDVFVLPSIIIKNDMDGIPVVLMEAISYGIPIITTNISGIPEIFNNNGCLIEQKSTDAIIDSFQHFVNSAEAKTFSKNSLEMFKQFNILENSKNKIINLNWNSQNL